MRESIDLRLFNVGLVSNPDQEDIPNEAQTEGSYNLDVDSQGKLKGILKQTSFSGSLGAGGTVFGWINRPSVGKWTLVFTDGMDLKIIEDFYGTPSESTVQTGVVPTSIITNNEEVHIGLGSSIASAWLGYISHGQFGGSAPSSIQYDYSTPARPTSSSGVTDATGTITVTESDAIFPKSTEYEYAMSYIYDGYQESPLSATTSTIQIDDWFTDIQVQATIKGYSSISKRITGVKIYRRARAFYLNSAWTSYEQYLHYAANYEDIPDAGNYGSWGEYKLIEDIDINDTSWATSGSDKVYTISDLNNPGTSYYNNVGISDVETNFSAYYTLSTMANNMLFISGIYHEDIPTSDAAHMILRSKPYRYDTFDLTNDKLILPTSPTAMKSHRGKLHVWDKNKTYVIDPNAFQIEKIIEGRGCSSQQSVVETDYGLFWANENGVYWSETTENILKPVQDDLSIPIRSQYQSAVSGQTPILTYNSSRNQLLVHISTDVYAYNMVEKRWDYYQEFTLSSSDETTGAFTGKDGETYTVNEGVIYKDFSGTTRNYWSFLSKEFTANDPSQDKKFYKIISDYSGTVGIEYSTDGGASWTTASTEDIGVVTSKSIRLRVRSSTTNATLDSISIIYRRLRGKR